MADEHDADTPEQTERPEETQIEAAGETPIPAEELLAEEAAVEATEELIVEAEAEAIVEAVAEELVEEAIVEATEELIVEAEVEAVVEAVAEELVEEAIVEEIVSEIEAEEEEEPAPRVKPSVPGAHLEVDIVPEGVDPLAPEQPADPYALEDDEEPKVEQEEADNAPLAEPISSAAIDLAAGARYNATGKRKTAIARVVLRPGSGTYLVNGRALDEHFPRVTLQRNIRQPLETVGYQERMDVVARLHGGGISAQAGALRHGISRALLEADPNLRGELKRRGFLTRDSRAKERKKAGLKKARKRPQFSKR
jgi:small subunit ribosomal protein S9